MSGDAPRVSARIAAEVVQGGESPSLDAPWKAQHAEELLRASERLTCWWKREAERLQDRNKVLSAACEAREGAVSWMEAHNTTFYGEVKTVREFLRRYDPRNWAELCVSALKGLRGDADSKDYTSDITWCTAFKDELAAIYAIRDEECRMWLEGHSFRIEKQSLVKNAHRLSGRKAGWMNSLFKFDHSQRDEQGHSLRVRETMCEGSSVRAPELFNPRKVRELEAAELRCGECDAEGNDLGVNAISADGKAAYIRNVEQALWDVLDGAADGHCGGMASKGVPGDEHWLILTMDGANVSRTHSGVRVSVFPGSVELMNQSKGVIRNLSTHKATSRAESYSTLDTRCAAIRKDLGKIYRRGFITRARVATADNPATTETVYAYSGHGLCVLRWQ